MSDFQEEKRLVLAFHQALDAAMPRELPGVLEKYCALDLDWVGFHPFNDLAGPQAVAATFWQPFHHAFSSPKRRQDIFFAGWNAIDDFNSLWVVSMGNLMGLFDHPWLGIKPTRKLAFLRYCEFNRIAGGRIAETALYCDIPHLMRQAGQSPFQEQRGAHLVQPGPQTHQGLLFDNAPATEGEKTLELINDMVTNLGAWQSGLPLEEELALNWRDDMLWWGPEGIGATYTIARYAEQHAGPFRAAFTDRSSTNHRARLAEGNFGGFFGRPNFTARHKGGFLDMPASDQLCDFRVIDIYRREGDKLVENWIFIDLLHWLKQQGRDPLAQ